MNKVADFIIRAATVDDTPLLLRVVDMASEGLIPAIWEGMNVEGKAASTFGATLVAADEGEFSHRHGFVLERGGESLGGMIGYRLPETPMPVEPDVPEAFVSVIELENLVAGYWYINMVAVAPEGRGQGLGAALLNEAEIQARKLACPGIASVVAASNAVAIGVYERAGYCERARRPFDLAEFGSKKTDALLMVKEFD